MDLLGKKKVEIWFEVFTLAGGSDLKNFDSGSGPDLKKSILAGCPGLKKISILAGGPGRYSLLPPNLGPCQCMVPEAVREFFAFYFLPFAVGGGVNFSG